MDRSSRQESNKATEVLNDTIEQLDFIDIFRTLHPPKPEDAFFSSARGTFSRIDHIVAGVCVASHLPAPVKAPLLLIPTQASCMLLQSLGRRCLGGAGLLSVEQMGDDVTSKKQSTTLNLRNVF